MKVILLNLTPRRKEVLWHAAYSTAEWSVEPVPYNRWAGYWIRLGDTEVGGIVHLLKRERLIEVQIKDVTKRRSKINIRITPLGMDVLLGNVACVEARK